jgi:hypothetical protein
MPTVPTATRANGRRQGAKRDDEPLTVKTNLPIPCREGV